MDWSVNPRARQSSLSGQPFRNDETVFSVLIIDETGELQRLDLREFEIDEIDSSAQIVARWRTVMRLETDPDETAADPLRTCEDMFRSLYEDEDTDSDEVAILKQLLALILERKRILRRVGAHTGRESAQCYLRAKTRETFEVPNLDFSPEAVARIRERLNELV